ncbi:MAG: extracellular solute-binding protein [Actinomycetota bacterium]
MRRILVAVTAFALIGAACTAGGDEGPASPTDANASHEPVTIEIWGAWTGRELKQFNAIFDNFTAQYPWITVESVGAVDDPKIIAAINSGTPPAAVLSFGLDSVGKFCQSGAWQDLTPFIERDGYDLSQFPDAVFKYTSFGGSQCALPFLTDAYGLYYNLDKFENARLSGPPKTISELTDYAKQLTEFNPDGSIKVMGLVPFSGYYETNSVTLSIPFGAKWYSEDGTTSAVDTDPQWKAIADWQKELVDFYGGPEAVTKFVAQQGDEFSSSNDFETGRVAMNIDGEWRTAFIENEVPDLNYMTAPIPVPDDMADSYGVGQIGGTIIGIPKGSPDPESAWLLVSWMASDTDTLVYMANNVRNVPTTTAALESPDLEVTPQFQTFLDIFANPSSHYKETSAIGSLDQDLVGGFLEKWQQGKVTDLQAGLDQVAEQINAELAQASGP